MNVRPRHRPSVCSPFILDTKKVLGGTQAALSVGLPAMRQQCPRFDRWVAQLLALSVGPP